MLSVNSNVPVSSANISKAASAPAESEPANTEPTKSTELPNAYYAPNFKGKIPNKLISEGNLKETVEKLDILNDKDGLKKVLKDYTDDMDKCTLASSYEEYESMCQRVNKKWQCLVDKYASLSASENKEIAQKADESFGEHMVPALLHFQEVFQKMDNSKMVRDGYNAAYAKNAQSRM